MQTEVIAEWQGKQYKAVVNDYGVATIAADTKPEEEPVCHLKSPCPISS